MSVSRSTRLRPYVVADEPDVTVTPAHTVLEWPNVNGALGAVSFAADLTSPDVSLIFLALFAAVAYFHEQNFAYTTIAIGCWVAIQVAGHAIKDEFRSDLIWGLAGKAVFYLLIGHGWAIAKLCFEVWQGRYTQVLSTCTNTTLSGSLERVDCFANFVFSQKWHLTRWTTIWPISMAHTLSNDPIRIIADVTFTWSKYRIASLVESVFVGSTTAAAIPASVLALRIVGGTIAYLVLGYIWTHAKLFVDVWYGVLPARLDAELCELYAKKQSYWEFIIKIKWLVLMWMLFWPLSIVYSLTQHPLRMLVDLVYRLSQRKYRWIIGRAMEMRMSKPKDE